jgi:hypothetical protein
VTHHGGMDQPAYVDKQRLETDEQIIAVKKHLQKNQEIIMGAKMCHCHPGNAKAS